MEHCIHNISTISNGNSVSETGIAKVLIFILCIPPKWLFCFILFELPVNILFEYIACGEGMSRRNVR